MTGVSVLVLTYNEELNLPGCLESASWSDDVHVVDSGSRWPGPWAVHRSWTSWWYCRIRSSAKSLAPVKRSMSTE